MRPLHLILAALALLAVVVTLALVGAGARETTQRTRSTAEVGPKEDVVLVDRPQVDVATSTAQEESRSVAFAPGSEAIRPVRLELHGHVIDREGVPVPLVAITLEDGAQVPLELGVTDQDGSFDLDITVTRTPAQLGLRAPWRLAQPFDLTWGGSWILDSSSSRHDPDQPLDLLSGNWDDFQVLVAERVVTVTGSVLDSAGDPVEGVEVALCAPGRFYDRSDPRICLGPAVYSDSLGGFTLDVTVLPRLSLRAHSIRYEYLEVPLEPEAGPVTLRLSYRSDAVTGRVVDESGAPLRAQIAMQLRDTQSHPDTGEFALSLKSFIPLDEPLVVAAVGKAPTVLHGVGARFVALGRQHPPLEIVLQDAGRLAGKVLDHAGNPASHVQVSVLDPEPLGDVYAEAYASPQGMLTTTVESDGSFLFDGLTHRPYTVVALDPERIDRVELEAQPNAEDLILKLPPPGSRRTVTGRLSYIDGQPAGGLGVWATFKLPGAPYRDHVFTSGFISKRRAAVAPDGTFQLVDLPSQDLVLVVASDKGIYPTSFPIPEGTTHAEYVISRLCFVNLLWPVDADPPDLASALSSLGEEFPIFRQDWGVYRKEPRLMYVGAKGIGGGEGAGGYITASFSVPENATLLLLERRGKEILRLPLSPKVDEHSTVMP